MNKKQFETYVAEAIDNIPEPYSEKLGEISFVVEESPDQDQRDKLGLRDCDALFGLYEGVPLPKRQGQMIMKVPDKISIFMHPMIEIFRDEQSLKNQIYQTVWHEIAHYFGLNHNDIADRQHR